MVTYVDLKDDEFVGTKMPRFTVIGKSKIVNKNHHNIVYKCLCECGNVFYRRKDGIIGIKNGACTKCKRIRMGCDYKTKSPLYRIYYAMKQRCYDHKSSEYRNYGARGIKVCEEWLESYVNFYNWCMLNGYIRGLQLDRIDNNSDYSPNNCRFVTPMQNSNNKRTCIYIEYKGAVHTINEWSRILGINKNTFWRYVRVKKYSIEYIINTYKGGDVYCHAFC